MQNGSEQRGGEEAPLYIRWNPERASHAIELRLELVPVIADELRRADKLSMEVGGLLIGSLPSANNATLRIDEIEMVPRGLEEGTIYILNPGQHDRLAEIRRRAKERQREAVGFFRSHLRPGAMRPSLADRGLLSGEFGSGIYAVLLIEGRQPYNATFFLGANGQLPNESAVKSFRFDEREFRALPEVQPEPAVPVPQEPTPEPRKRAYGTKAYGTIAALLGIAAVACGFMWYFARQSLPVPILLSTGTSSNRAEATNPMGIAIAEHGGMLRITWDHAARELDHAAGATLLIVEGASRRELQLGADELRLGAVEYESSGGPVEVTMSVDKAGDSLKSPVSATPGVNQTIHWTPR
jgi:hypothetical protein